MKGWVTLTNSDIDLFSKAVEVIDNFTPEYVTEYEYKYRWFKKVEYKAWNHSPLWYSARNHIKSELENLMSLLWQGKDVKLWLDSYNEIIKLSNGDTNAVTLTHITQGEA